MKLFVTLYQDVSDKPDGIPDAWPAHVDEVSDDTLDPNDGRLSMTLEEFASYKEAHQGAYDSWYSAFTLYDKKVAKAKKIDRHTSELIANGFVFGGQTFSLSTNAQSTLTGMYAIRDEPFLTFPVKFNTLDDQGYVELGDSSQVRTFYLTAVGTYRSVLDAGTALKDQIRAANSQAALDAVVDNR